MGFDARVFDKAEEQALLDADHARYVDSERKMVVDDIELARAAIVGALMAVERLMGDEVYDVEYAEGDGGFVQKFLLDAQKAVVGAQSIAKGIGQAGDALARVHV